jgi:hypothetical protein
MDPLKILASFQLPFIVWATFSFIVYSSYRVIIYAFIAELKEFFCDPVL